VLLIVALTATVMELVDVIMAGLVQIAHPVSHNHVIFLTVTDINECIGQNSCVSPLVCENAIGSYTCSCTGGLHISGSNCVPCPLGTTSNETNAVNCYSCNPGTYSLYNFTKGGNKLPKNM
jgi:hypothetical protein